MRARSAATAVAVGVGVAIAASTSDGKASSRKLSNAPMTIRVFNMKHQAFPTQVSLPGVVLYVPANLEAPFRVVIYMRGIRTTVRDAVEPLFQLVPSNTILIAPEFTANNETEDPGKFSERGALDDFLAEVWGAPEMAPVRALGISLPAAVAIVAHSGGYRPAAAVILDSARKKRIAEVAVLDAVYALPLAFEMWAGSAECRHFSSVTRADGTPGENARVMANDLGAQIKPVTKAVPQDFSPQYAFVSTTEQHPAIPQAFLRAILTGWGIA